MALVFEKMCSLGKGVLQPYCGITLYAVPCWHSINCQLSFPATIFTVWLPSRHYIGYTVPAPLHQLQFLPGIGIASPKIASQVASHCFSLPTAGITFSCQVIEWHCNSICCHWMALHFQTLPAYGSTYVNGFASTSGCPHAMPQCFCLYGIHVR